MNARRHLKSWLIGFAVLVCACDSAAAQSDLYSDIEKALFHASKEFRESRPDEALKHLNDALKLIDKFKSTDRPNERDYLQEAYMWINFNPPEVDQALGAIKKALAKNPQSAEAIFLRGYVQTKYKANTQSSMYNGLEDLKTAMKRRKEITDPVNKNWVLDAANEMSHVFDTLKRFDLAASEFKTLSEQEPTEVNYLFFLGMAQLKLKNFEGAADAFAKGLEQRPSDLQMHQYYGLALRETGDKKSAIAAYEAFLKRDGVLKSAEDVFTVQMALAVLYLEDNQDASAKELLRKAKKSPALLDPKNHANPYIRSMRVELAKGLAKLDEHAEALPLFAQVLASLPANMDPGSKVNLTRDYAKSLIRANRVKDGIKKLDEALRDLRFNSPNEQEPLDILYELGVAHWKLAKQEKTRTDHAEIYFRKYLQELRQGTAGALRYSSDVEIAENLGKLYADANDHAKAAEYFAEALALIDVAIDKEKCPRTRIQYENLEALAGSKQWDKCISAAGTLVADKEYGLKTRRLLAQAYLENEQWHKAIEQLNTLKGTKEWNDYAVLFMGQALLKTDRAEEALTYVEEAIKARPDDEKRKLEHAEVLRVLGRSDEARELYEKTIKMNPSAVQAHIGLGELELQLAKVESGSARVDLINQAVGHFKEAKRLKTSSQLLEKLSQAERDLADARAEVQIQASRRATILYTGALLLAPCIPIGFMIYFYRRQWAMRCFHEVLDLERDLKQLIRDRVASRLNGNWERLGEAPFRGRLPYRMLQERSKEKGGKDILSAANFGHLVAIIDDGWKELGFNELCAAELVDPKVVIIANLSYISSCRACLAHVGALDELGGKHTRRHTATDAELRPHLTKHLHGQVKTSLRIIRSKFNVKPAKEQGELPVLASGRED